MRCGSAYLLFTPLLAACSQEELLPGEEDTRKELELSTEWVIQETRSGSYTGTSENQWTGNEEITVTAGNNTKTYTVQNDGSVKAGNNGPIYWTNNNPLTVSAYYTPVSSLTTRYKIETGQNQTYDASTGITKFDRSDALYAPPVTVKYGETAQLSFRHLTAYVIIHVTTDSSTEIENMSNASIKIVNQHTESGIVSSDGSVAQQTTVGTKSITPLSTGNDATYKEAKALLVPQHTTGSKFITVSFNNNSIVYSYTPLSTHPIHLEAGKKYTFNLKLTKTNLVLESQSIKDWEVESETIVSDPPRNP